MEGMDDAEIDEFVAEVEEKARELIGDAIARDAQFEAVLCGEALVALGASQIEEVFSDIEDVFERVRHP